jgi:hypothetical protein
LVEQEEEILGQAEVVLPPLPLPLPPVLLIEMLEEEEEEEDEEGVEPPRGTPRYDC